MRNLLSASSLLLAAGAVADVHIPEPMVFDLVHSFGVEKGAFEANVLALAPLNDASDRPVEWAPEVEYAMRDGLAVEFELEFEDSDLEAYKFAAQWTFDPPANPRRVHGSQVIVEKFDGADIWELTALYLTGLQFNEDDSVMMMFGFRSEVGGDSDDHDEVLINVSFFRELGPRMTIGLENDLAIDFDDDAERLVFPQIHYEISEHLEIQFGAGAEIDDDDTDFSAGFRFIYATPGP